jgi:tetratricopeptide (TPR) repeat protein
MNTVRAAKWFWPLLGFALTASAQQTLARMDHTDAPVATASLHETAPHSKYTSQPAGINDSSHSRAAARALFVSSDLRHARLLAEKALAVHPNDLEAAFILMEAAVVEADGPTMLDSALQLCRHGSAELDDARVQLAGARLREAAANTPQFRRVVPQIQELIANGEGGECDLNEALLQAAMDGVPGLNPYSLSRNAGILTDWRIVGPLSRRTLAGAAPQELPRNEDLSAPLVYERAVENFQFPDGSIRLPDYLTHRGVFYAASQFAMLEPGMRVLHVQSTGAVDVFVDGALALKITGKAQAQPHSAVLELAPGPHRVLVRFTSDSAPLQVRIEPQLTKGGYANSLAASSEETAYRQAGAAYAVRDWAAVSRLLNGHSSAPALYLAGQAAADGAVAKAQPESLSGENQDPLFWSKRVAAHPSCENVQGAIGFYRSTGQVSQAAATEQRLDGCAPESLLYAQVLSSEGRHHEASASLSKLLAESPLNREAQLMLIRELQLAGHDRAAQKAAAEWERMAPNAHTYRRLAALFSGDGAADGSPKNPAIPFYMPFRRNAVLPSAAIEAPGSYGDIELLMDDHVAIARADGSVSLYVHRAVRALTDKGAAQIEGLIVPSDSQPLTVRRLWRVEAANSGKFSAGDAIELEYVTNYLGDGGIADHPEAFQYVFDQAAVSSEGSRFVVLMPAGSSDGGVVIASSDAPQMTSKISDGMLARIWENASTHTGSGFAIVRVVEHDNGWTTPRSAERRKRIETSHPGPRLLDAALGPIEQFNTAATSDRIAEETAAEETAY